MALEKHEVLPPVTHGGRGKSPLREYVADAIADFWFSDMKVARMIDCPKTPAEGEEKKFANNLAHMCDCEIKEQNLVGKVSAHVRGHDVFLMKR